MKRYNSSYEQFSVAKTISNQRYLDKLEGPVQELLAFGYGYRSLANALNQKGYLTQRGNPFTRDSVITLLTKLGLHTAGAASECKDEN